MQHDFIILLEKVLAVPVTKITPAPSIIAALALFTSPDIVKVFVPKLIVTGAVATTDPATVRPPVPDKVIVNGLSAAAVTSPEDVNTPAVIAKVFVALFVNDAIVAFPVPIVKVAVAAESVTALVPFAKYPVGGVVPAAVLSINVMVVAVWVNAVAKAELVKINIGDAIKAVVKRQASLLDKNLFLVMNICFLFSKLLIIESLCRDFEFFKNYKF